jgi:hypothetical protein
VTSTIYATFRQKQGTFSLFPQPPPGGLDVHFEYVGFNWVQDGFDPNLFKSKVEKSSDRPVYNRLLMSRYVKVKYREAKDMDTTRAQADWNLIYQQITGQSTSPETLDAGGFRYGPPYLNSFRNTPDSGYGVV